MVWSFLFGQTCVAEAQVTTLRDAGSWRAVQAVDGSSHVCSMHSSFPDGRIFFIHFTPAGEMLVQLSSPQWRMRTGFSIGLAIQFDRLPSRNMNSQVIYMPDSAAAMLQIAVNTDEMDGFIEDFKRSLNMSIIFRTGNEGNWTFNLNGSASVADAFSECIERMPATTQP